MSARRETMLDGLCRLLQPRHIILVGARDSALAQVMLAAAMRAGAILHIIAEAPGGDLGALRAQGGDACVLHDAPPAVALGLLPVPALCWVDADPNWHTTQAVLGALEAQAGRLGAALPVVVIQGAGWPHGRRDGYDDPAAIPGHARHPHERAGLLPGQAMLAGSAGLYADHYHAVGENEPRNGVLTAAEDFIEGRSSALRSVVLPGFGGLMAIVPRTGAGAQAFSPASLADYLGETAQALEAVRLDQQVAAAGNQAELRRAVAMIDLLRGAAQQAEAAGGERGMAAAAARVDQDAATAAAEAELRRARGMIDLLRGALRRAGHAPQTPAAGPASLWRRRLRHALDLARRAAGRARRDPAAADPALDRLRASPVMDGNWYLEHYPDVAAAQLDPAEHYLRHGAAELRDPGPHFSSSAYLLAHPDVAEAGLNPLLHYLFSGAAEGRNTGGDFDACAYLAAHPQAASAGANPLEHFAAARARG